MNRNHKIIALWCAPRSASSALFRAFQQLPNAYCLFEPFAQSFYFSKERLSFRYLKKGQFAPRWNQYIGAKVIKNILNQNHKDITLFKECAFQASRYFKNDFFKKIDYHIFIIRDPQLTLHSLLKYKPDFTELEAGYTALFKLYKKTVALKKSIIIIDSNDLRSKPEQMMKQLCAQIDICYTKHLTHWKKRTNLGFGNQSEFYEKVLNSTTFLPPDKQISFPKFALAAHNAILRNATITYKTLHEKRLQLP